MGNRGPNRNRDDEPPVCADDTRRIHTPVGQPCVWCEQAIEDEDRGIEIPGLDAAGQPELRYAHIECNLRNTLGCYKHLSGIGHDHDVDYRTDALAVWSWAMRHDTF